MNQVSKYFHQYARLAEEYAQNRVDQSWAGAQEPEERDNIENALKKTREKMERCKRNFKQALWEAANRR